MKTLNEAQSEYLWHQAIGDFSQPGMKVVQMFYGLLLLNFFCFIFDSQLST
jgi:hypothetical protein